MGISDEAPLGYSWAMINTDDIIVKKIHLGCQNLGWIVDDKQRLLVRSGVCETYPVGDDNQWGEV